MAHNQSGTDIHVDVTIDSDQGAARFRYTPTEYVDENGDIDLTKLPRGTAKLCFRLQISQITLDRTPYNLGFATGDSIWITEAECGQPTGPYRARGILACIGLIGPQFYGYSNPGQNLGELHLFNRNNDCKEYKYTLRVFAAGAQGARWLEHDPRIKNGGGGGLF